MRNKIYLAILVLLVLTISCENEDPEPKLGEQEEIIPQETFIHIPSSLNETSAVSKLKVLSGKEIYNYIRQYLGIIDNATKIIETAYDRIAAIENNGTLEFNHTGIDGKTKIVSITETYRDSTPAWDYFIEIYNETFADKALQAWWNTSPFEQKIYFKPSSLNSTQMTEHEDAMIEIIYKSGDAAAPYEKSMFAAVDGLTLAGEISFAPDNIVVFIGQNGNILDISGASNNPDVALLDYYYRGGRNWTFLAKINTQENIAVAQLALPASYIESNEILFTDYAFKKVILDEIKLVYPGNDLLSDNQLFSLAKIDGSMIENTAYFDQQGFLSAGEPPSASYSNLANFEGLTPYIPVFVRDYKIEFEE